LAQYPTRQFARTGGVKTTKVDSVPVANRLTTLVMRKWSFSVWQRGGSLKKCEATFPLERCL